MITHYAKLNLPSVELTREIAAVCPIAGSYLSYVSYLMKKELSLTVSTTIRNAMKTLISTAGEVINKKYEPGIKHAVIYSNRTSSTPKATPIKLFKNASGEWVSGFMRYQNP